MPDSDPLTNDLLSLLLNIEDIVSALKQEGRLDAIIKEEDIACTLLRLGNGTGKPAGIAPVTRTRTRRTILPESPRVTRQNEPKNIEIGQVLREIYSK